jgi:hypothetical protein
MRTLDAAMPNEQAATLGEIARTAGGQRAAVGDAIDRGLILRRMLEEAGFGLVRLGEADPGVPRSGVPDFWLCKTCGCLWRDNHDAGQYPNTAICDGSVSLGAKQTSCAKCEANTLPPITEPLYRVAVPRSGDSTTEKLYTARKLSAGEITISTVDGEVRLRVTDAQALRIASDILELVPRDDAAGAPLNIEQAKYDLARMSMDEAPLVFRRYLEKAIAELETLRTAQSAEARSGVAPLDLEPIRQRERAATPTPWTAGWSGDPDDQGKDDAGPIDIVSTWRGGVARCSPSPTGHASTWDQVEANAAFIAHARQDIPALLAEIDRLRALSSELLARYSLALRDGKPALVNDSNGLWCSYRQAAQRIVAAEVVSSSGATPQEWLPIETIPEKGPVLVASGDLIWIACHPKRTLAQRRAGGGPTHWLPLPQPPGTVRASSGVAPMSTNPEPAWRLKCPWL